MSSGVCSSMGTPVVVLWCVYSSGCVVVECVCVCMLSSGVCSSTGTPVVMLWCVYSSGCAVVECVCVCV